MDKVQEAVDDAAFMLLDLEEILLDYVGTEQELDEFLISKIKKVDPTGAW